MEGGQERGSERCSIGGAKAGANAYPKTNILLIYKPQISIKYNTLTN